MSKILPVVFSISPKPCSMEEIHHLCRYFQKLGPLIDLNYKPSNIGKLSIQYPNRYYAFYEAKTAVVNDLVKKLNNVKGIPRLEFYNNTMNNKDETAENRQKILDFIDRKAFEQIKKLDYARHFHISCFIQKFGDLRSDITAGKENREANAYIADIKTQGYFSRAFSADNKANKKR